MCEYTGPATVSQGTNPRSDAHRSRPALLRCRGGARYPQLYSTRARSKTSAFFAQPEGDGVRVIVAVQTRSVVREIEIDGAQNRARKRLRKDIEVKINPPVNEEKLEKGRQKIIDTYQGARVSTTSTCNSGSIRSRKPWHRARVYTVNEGGRARSKHRVSKATTISGTSVLRKQMKTQGRPSIAFIDKSGRLDEAQLQQDLDSISEFYQNHGYIDIASERRAQGTVRSGPIVIMIAINEGAQYHVGKLTFTGYKTTTEEKLRAVIKMKEGSIYSPKATADDAKDDRRRLWRRRLCRSRSSARRAPPAVPGIDRPHYKIEEGERSFVERINIVGNTRTKDKVIRREVLIAAGRCLQHRPGRHQQEAPGEPRLLRQGRNLSGRHRHSGRKDLTSRWRKNGPAHSISAPASARSIADRLRRIDPGQLRYHELARPHRRRTKIPDRAQVGTQRKDFSWL